MLVGIKALGCEGVRVKKGEAGEWNMDRFRKCDVTGVRGARGSEAALLPALLLLLLAAGADVRRARGKSDMGAAAVVAG